jgi:hypothetical protein
VRIACEQREEQQRWRLTGTDELQSSEPNETAWVSSILAGPMTPKGLARALGVSEPMLGQCFNADDSRSYKSSTT